MYRAGNGRGGRGRSQGPWNADETVIALDAKTGKTIWEHTYASRREDFSFGAGPHSTPLVVGDRLFTIGTNQQLLAFEKRTGKILWSHDFIKEFNSPELLIRPVVKTGYACSPIAYRDTIICSVGGPGQSVMAFRQSDGAVVWKSGDFLTSGAAPILIDFEGTPQMVFLAGGTVTALNPDNGEILWSHPHDPGNDLNCATPIWGSDNVLFVSSAYRAGSRAIQLTRRGDGDHPRRVVVHQPRALHVPQPGAALVISSTARPVTLVPRFSPHCTSRPVSPRGSIVASAAPVCCRRGTRRSSWTRTAISR